MIHSPKKSTDNHSRGSEIGGRGHGGLGCGKKAQARRWALIHVFQNENSLDSEKGGDQIIPIHSRVVSMSWVSSVSTVA